MECLIIYQCCSVRLVSRFLSSWMSSLKLTSSITRQLLSELCGNLSSVSTLKTDGCILHFRQLRDWSLSTINDITHFLVVNMWHHRKHVFSSPRLHLFKGVMNPKCPWSFDIRGHCSIKTSCKSKNSIYAKAAVCGGKVLLSYVIVCISTASTEQDDIVDCLAPPTDSHM